MSKPKRIPCIIPFCRRTVDPSHIAPSHSEVICAKHWRLVPKRLRALHLARQARNDALPFQSPEWHPNHPDFSTWARTEAAAYRSWRKCKDAVMKRIGDLG